MVREIRTTHPAPFAKVGEVTFLRNAETLEADLPRLSEEQRMVRAMRLVASIGDGHTQLNPVGPEFALWYPVRLFQFTDGYFITSAHQSVRELVGAQVLEIAGRPVAEVAEAARDLRGADNAFDRMQRIEALHCAPLMRGLGYADEVRRLHLRLRLRHGRVVERVLTPSPTNNSRFSADEPAFSWDALTEVYTPPMAPYEEMISAYRGLPASAYRDVDLTRPPHFMYRRLQVARAIPEHDAFYMQFNAVAPEEMLPFLRQQMAAIETQRPRRLIIDLRYNPGGDGSRNIEVVHQFVERLPKPPWRELYLILGRRTFSAAVNLADALIDNVPLTVVGEPPGAALNHLGDAAEHDYQHPRLALFVSTRRHQMSESDDLRSIMAVDMPAQMSSADYVAGRDSAVDPILNGAEMRSIPQIALSDGGTTARRAWDDRRVRFASLSWWSPPTELAMRAVCGVLREQNRLQDSLETCRLTTEMQPYVWNSWYNLSLVQHAMGQTRERAASLKCVLALDANNFNLNEIRQALAESGDVPLPSGCPVEAR